LEPFPPANQLADFAIGIGEVPESDGSPHAGLGAGREINVVAVSILFMKAEGTLPRFHAKGAVFGREHPVKLRRRNLAPETLAIEVVLPLVKDGDAIRASLDAFLDAFADVWINKYNAVWPFLDSFGWACFQAGGFLAVHTGSWEPLAPNPRILADFFLQYGVVQHPRRRFVFLFAGYSAGTAKHASLEVNRHTPAAFSRCHCACEYPW